MEKKFLAVILTNLTLMILYVNSCNNSPQNLRAQKANTKDFEIDISYDIIPKNDTLSEFSLSKTPYPERHIKLLFLVPQSIERRQRIRNIIFEPEPDKLYKENKNLYAEYSVNPDDLKTSLKIHMEGSVYKFDMATAVSQGYACFEPNPNFETYLLPEEYIEVNNPKIQKIADSIDVKDTVGILKAIYNYVAKNLQYELSEIERIGASNLTKHRKGVCLDYCDLFVALCRAKQIPARVVLGFVTQFDINCRHAWVEVHIDNYGWIPIDPTRPSDLPDGTMNYSFYHLPNIFLTLGYWYENCGIDINSFNFFGFNNRKSFSKNYEFMETIKFIKPIKKTVDSRDVIREIEEAKIKKILHEK